MAEEIVNTEEQADELLESIEQPQDTPMHEEKPDPQGEKEGKKSAQEIADEHAITVGGKEIKATIDKIKRWAEMGYEAPNKLGALQKQLEEYKAKEATLSELEKKYGEVDKYARENPQWLETIMTAYQNRDQQPGQQGPAKEIVELQNQMKEILTLKETLMAERQAAKAKQDEEAYFKDFNEIKEKYKDIDLESPGEDGKTLEFKILEHAQKNNIPNFKTAFRDYMHDELLSRTEQKAKEKVVSDRVAKSKLGILGTSPTPKTVVKDYVKGKSYNDLEQEALQELGIT